MKRLALQVEHRVKNRIVGVHTLNENSDLCTIGSARTAKIRVLGDDVAGLHAAFDRDGEQWTVCDLGSTSGTWINKKAIVSQTIKEPTLIHIGTHTLKVTPHEYQRDMFANTSREQNGKFTYHQVVMMKNGLMRETVLLPKNEAFRCELKGVGSLPAPKGFDWIETRAGDWTVKQRLTMTDQVPETTLQDAFLDDLKRPAPLAAAILIFLMMLTLSLLAPTRPGDEMKTLTPEMQNQYTRMIFDGKKVKEQKAIAEKMRKSMKGQSQSGVAKNTPGGDAGAKAANNKPAAKVIANLKNAGLSALIGKVAARASKNAQLVQAAGVNAAESKASGRAFSLGGGTALDKVGGGGGHGNDTQKVGGLGTAGKGGGSTGYKGTGALSLGNTGNAEVGVLEQETEVDGGLDKEIIARYIKSQLGQIRYCYERQLSANPDLYGKILVKFTIGAAGSVVAQTIGTTSLNNAMVEGCILRRIAGWQFPTPKGGTKVLVTYPFLFKSNR